MVRARQRHRRADARDGHARGRRHQRVVPQHRARQACRRPRPEGPGATRRLPEARRRCRRDRGGVPARRRQAAWRRLRCGWRRGNPSIVYCSISAFGQHGPYRDKPAHDLAVAGAGGNRSPRGRLPCPISLPPTLGVVADGAVGDPDGAGGARGDRQRRLHRHRDVRLASRLDAEHHRHRAWPGEAPKPAEMRNMAARR